VERWEEVRLQFQDFFDLLTVKDANSNCCWVLHSIEKN
jgi:hypothetical protein